MTSCWSARRPTPARATPSPRPAAGCRWWSSTGRSRSSDPTARSRSSTCSRAATSSWSTSPCGTTARRTRGSARAAPSTLWHMKDAVYLNARGVSFAVLTSGPWDEVAPYVEFMGYTQPWYSVRGVEAPIATEDGAHRLLPARRRPRVPHLLHDGPWQRAGRRVLGPARHDALRPPRGVGGQPRGLARGPYRPARRSVGMARRSAGTGARTPTASPPGARPAGPCRSGPAPARPPWRPSAGRSLRDRQGAGGMLRFTRNRLSGSYVGLDPLEALGSWCRRRRRSGRCRRRPAGS